MSDPARPTKPPSPALAPDVPDESTARALHRMEATGRPGRVALLAEEITYEPKRTPGGKLTAAAKRGELSAQKQIRRTLAEACARVLDTPAGSVAEALERLQAELGGEPLPQRYRVAGRLVAIATGDPTGVDALGNPTCAGEQQSIAAASWLADRIDGPVVQRAEVRGSNVVVHVTVPEDAADSASWAARWAPRLGETTTVQGG